MKHNPVKNHNKVTQLQNHYIAIRDSAVSWRRKGSYRKRIKNRVNKMIRSLLKQDLKNQIEES